MSFTKTSLENGDFGKVIYKIVAELGIPKATFLHSKMIRGWVDVTRPGVEVSKSSWRYGTEIQAYSSKNGEKWIADLAQRLMEEGFLVKASAGSLNAVPDFRRLDTKLVEELYQQACQTLRHLAEQRSKYPALYTKEWRRLPYVSKQTAKHLQTEIQQCLWLRGAIEDSRRVD